MNNQILPPMVMGFPMTNPYIMPIDPNLQLGFFNWPQNFDINNSMASPNPNFPIMNFNQIPQFNNQSPSIQSNLEDNN